MIPSVDDLGLPILQELADDRDHSVSKLRDRIAVKTGVTAEDRSVYLPSGEVRTYDNRIGWALKQLKVAQLISPTSRAVYHITEAGTSLLMTKPKRVDRKLLVARFPVAREYFERALGRKPPTASSTSSAPSASLIETPSGAGTPLQRLEEAHAELMGKTKADLVANMRGLDDQQFEVFIARLLPRLGYGTDPRDILQEHGGSGDGGIDGIVKLDSLGAERVYIQAKHWKAPVDLAPLTEFEEKVRTSGVKAGVFVALSGFDKKAEAFAKKHSHNIAWIDADQLADVMISKSVGVIQDGSYRVLRVDEDYFDQESD